MRNPLWNQRLTINCKGRLISLQEPIIMGILNATPDSFFPDSRTPDLQEAVDKAGAMIDQGASILDVGGYSSRPGSTEVSPGEEASRVIPIIEAIHKEFPDVPISVDTFRSIVAKEAIESGAGIVNDISGGDFDVEMWPMIAEMQVPYILMHMQGLQANMHQIPEYHDITVDIMDNFINKIGRMRALGIHDLILDPGFGFGKTLEQNYQLLRQLHCFRILGPPLMIGISRKSMIWKPLKIHASNALHGTTALHMVALQQGARILRVHDVEPARQVIQLWQLTREASNNV